MINNRKAFNKINSNAHPGAVFRSPKYTPKEVLIDHDLKPFLQDAFGGICRELEIKQRDIELLVRLIWNSDHSGSISDFEKQLQTVFARFSSPEKLRNSLDERAKRIAVQVSPYIVGDQIADIGCGDGVVSLFVPKNEFILVDICDYLDVRVHAPFHRYREGGSLRLPHKVDTSLLLTVLHHSIDPIQVLEETRKFTTRRTLVIESVYGVIDPNNASGLWNQENPILQKKYATFIDWLYNRVFHDGVPVPYNFAAPDNWMDIFKATGWNIITKLDLGVDQPIVPEYHVLFVIEPDPTAVLLFD